jgi:Leucine-rich repeat (LRR) protein
LIFLCISTPAFGECDCTNEAVTGVPRSECEILLAFYEAMGGENWDSNQGWNYTSPINDWWGVAVEDNHVTEIILHHNTLTGLIPPELGSLENLRILELWGLNSISGGIPPEIGNLSSLQELSMQGDLDGSIIPPELGNLTNLQVLYLRCGLTGNLPVELGNLTNLRELKLHSNNLNVNIPPELGNLTNLQELTLAKNQLTGPIPSELGNLVNLRELNLGQNKLTDLPPEIGSLTNLTSLNLGINQLKEIPAELGNLSNLCFLGLGRNLLNEIPLELNKLWNLNYLYLHNNQFSGSIPPVLGSLTGLRTLDLSQNHFSGQIPIEFIYLGNLELLYLSGNMLSGPILSELVNLPDLGFVDAGLGAYISKVDHNALFTDDPAIADFMQDKFGGWYRTQTIPPENIQVALLDQLPPAEQAPGEAASPGSNRVRITWDPIVYQEEDGGYEICLKGSVEGPCLPGTGITADKAEPSLVVSNLRPDTEYFIDLVTKTYPVPYHNPNTVISAKTDNFDITTGGTAVTAFPLWIIESGNFTGMAFSNYGNESAGFALTVYDENGLEQTVPVNPSLFTVEAGQQFARIATELFGVTPDIPAKLSWIEAASDQLAGSFFTFGSADLQMLDGAVTQSRPSRILWFTRPLASSLPAGQEESAEVHISLINPMDDPVELTLSLIQNDETLLEASKTIAAKGMLYSTTAELFGSQSLPEDGYLAIKVTEGTGVIGFSRVDFPVTRTTLGLNAAEPSSAETLYSAQLASGPGVGGTGMETHIRLVNPMEGEREVTFTAVAENGTLLADPVIQVLAGRTATEFRAWELFAFQGDSAVGSLVIDVNIGGVIGDVIFTPFEGIEYAAAMPLQTLPVMEAVFNHIANSNEIYTGLAFFNPGQEETQIIVLAKRGDGTIAGIKEITLGPGERISRTLKDPDMLPETASLLNGFISIVSTQPIFCQQLYGGTDLQFLAAVPPTTSGGSMFEQQGRP